MCSALSIYYVLFRRALSETKPAPFFLPDPFVFPAAVGLTCCLFNPCFLCRLGVDFLEGLTGHHADRLELDRAVCVSESGKLHICKSLHQCGNSFFRLRADPIQCLCRAPTSFRILLLQSRDQSSISSLLPSH